MVISVGNFRRGKIFLGLFGGGAKEADRQTSIATVKRELDWRRKALPGFDRSGKNDNDKYNEYKARIKELEARLRDLRA